VSGSKDVGANSLPHLLNAVFVRKGVEQDSDYKLFLSFHCLADFPCDNHLQCYKSLPQRNEIEELEPGFLSLGRS
jgi:hypothetical protein